MNEHDTTPLPNRGNTSAVTTAPAAGVDYDQAVEQFYEPLYKFAFGLTGCESDAADLTQDTYQVLLVIGGQIRDPHKLKSWLFTTLYRKFLGQRRHNSRFPEVQVEFAEWELPTVDAGVEDRLDANAVVGAVQSLEEKYRAPLVLFYLQELSYHEIAEVLGLPIGTIMSRLSRGKEILRKRLEDDKLGGFIRHYRNGSRNGNTNALVDAPDLTARMVHLRLSATAACG